MLPNLTLSGPVPLQDIRETPLHNNAARAIREEIALDRDTQNTPGSPNIFNAILEKIEKAAIATSR